MSEWSQVPFSDLLIESRDGEWGEGQEAFGHQLCEVIRGTDFAILNDPSIELPLRWIRDHLVERKRLTIGDILFEMAGGTAKQSTGRSALLKGTFFQDHEGPILCASFCRHLRLNLKRHDSAFIYYLLQALYKAGYMAVYNIQHTGVSRFQYTSFKKQTVLDVPLLPTQKKIAATLSAYDDLIENNQRRIVLLETMAEEIYREWFVRLRFPGHEKVKFVKGLPADWDIKRVKEIVTRKQFGRIYREAELFDGGQVVIIDQSRVDCLGYHDGEAQHLASPDSPILLFGDHSCKMILMTKPFSLAENVIPFNSKPNVSPYFLFHLVKDLARTTEYKRHWTDLMNREVLVPVKTLQVKFEGSVKRNHEEIEILREAIRKSEKVRNMLLPRLISGKLSVENLDIQFPPGMVEPIHET